MPLPHLIDAGRVHASQKARSTKTNALGAWPPRYLAYLREHGQRSIFQKIGKIGNARDRPITSIMFVSLLSAIQRGGLAGRLAARRASRPFPHGGATRLLRLAFA